MREKDIIGNYRKLGFALLAKAKPNHAIPVSKVGYPRVTHPFAADHRLANNLKYLTHFPRTMSPAGLQKRKP